MESTNIHDLEQTLDMLLKPMGLQVHCQESNGTIQVKGISNKAFYGAFLKIDPWGYQRDKRFFANLKRFLSQLGKIEHFKEISIGIFAGYIGTPIENIYLGCNSLEEMMIARDLIA